MKILKLLFALSLLISVNLQAQQAQWELVRENFTGKIAFDPFDANIIYIAPGSIGDYGLTKSTDGGKTWTNYRNGYDGLGANGIEIDRSNPKRLWVYGGAFNGIARSEDGGMTATLSDSGIIFDHHGFAVTALAYDHIRDILYAADYTTFLGIYRSRNGGRSWELMQAHGHPSLLTPNFFMIEEDSGWVYSGTFGHGLWRSKDSVKTWESLQPATFDGKNISFIARVPNSRTLYAVGRGEVIYKSYDLGETWITISHTVLDSGYFDSGLLISSLDTNYVFVAASGHGLNELKGGFFMSSDGGKSWQVYHANLPQHDLWKWNIQALSQPSGSQYLLMSVSSPLLATYKISQAVLTSVRESPLSSPPSGIILQQNYPNPFNAQTKIEFSLAERRLAKLDIYGIAGNHIITLTHSYFDSGNHSVTWNSENPKGGEVGSGIYLCRLSTGEEVFTRKLLLIR